ncbi:hypothetical protein [Bartonella raoultii]|uniref:Protein-disulfide reductase n=1 Tax=Bartonella raoultii TaxID=1457020 RepID=A0ABS7I6R2_9HYPH|nr:hypothetical protein [Bartonella raoultii]MBX4336122.1 hypothetical protein [Bartonella raoultii]
MYKIFKNYAFSVCIAITFLLSHIVNVNAHHLINVPKKESIAQHTTEQKNDLTYKAVRMAALYTPAVSHGQGNEAIIGGKIEKVVEPMSIAIGIMCTGYVISIITSVIGWVKDIVWIFK